MAKALYLTQLIRPGGGPAGYCYNLERGISMISANNLHSFCAPRSEARHSLLERSISPSALNLPQFIDRATRGRLRKLRHSVRTRNRLGRKMRRAIEASDVVIIQGAQPVFLARHAATHAKRLVYMPHSPTPLADERASVAANIGEPLPDYLYRSLFAEEAELFDLADVIVFPSLNATAPYETAFGDFLGKVRIIESGVDDPGAHHGPLADHPLRVAFAGRYVGHKGYDLYCDMASRARDELGSGVEFISLGVGPIRSSDAVTDYGWQTSPHRILDQVHMVVIPNRVAYFDLLPLECAALGKGLVFSPVGGNLSQAAALPDSVLASELSSAALYNALRDAIGRRKQDRNWGMANRSAYLNRFTPESMARAWDRLVTDIS